MELQLISGKTYKINQQGDEIAAAHACISTVHIRREAGKERAVVIVSTYADAAACADETIQPYEEVRKEATEDDFTTYFPEAGDCMAQAKDFWMNETTIGDVVGNFDRRDWEDVPA